MLGVVLWSDSSDEKAVIWCEDQGDLAFWSRDADVTTPSYQPFDAGDLVQFDVIDVSNMRKASNPRLVIEQVGMGLPQALRDRYNTQLQERSAASNVIPFKPNTEICCELLPKLACIHS